MDVINPSFEQTDVAIVIGANDAVNPLARTVVVIKRSLSPGFAGIPNPLFAADNTLMYFADGKQLEIPKFQARRPSSRRNSLTHCLLWGATSRTS